MCESESSFQGTNFGAPVLGTKPSRKRLCAQSSVVSLFCACVLNRFRLLHAFQHQLWKCGGHSHAGEQNTVPQERVPVLGILSLQQRRWKWPCENLHPGVLHSPSGWRSNPPERNKRYSSPTLAVWMQARHSPQLVWQLAAEQGLVTHGFQIELDLSYLVRKLKGGSFVWSFLRKHTCSLELWISVLLLSSKNTLWATGIMGRVDSWKKLNYGMDKGRTGLREFWVWSQTLLGPLILSHCDLLLPKCSSSGRRTLPTLA